MRRPPHRVGFYALLILVPRKETIRIGRLGPIEFALGVYVYIGSALNSLEGRVSRHFRSTKRNHWHIDYLVGWPGVKLIGAALRPTDRRIECTMSRAVQKTAASSIQGFGCSDCDCDSHLHYFRALPTAFESLADLGFLYSHGGPI